MIRGHIAGLTAAVIALASLRALAQETGAAPARADSGDRLTKAKELFRKGVALYEAGDFARALYWFQLSMQAYPSVENTQNAAICLDKLGRFDEALELYEELLVTYKNKLAEGTHAIIGPAMASLREKVGTVSVASNVEGLAVIDGRARGKLPLLAPIRVLAGRHKVRVLKDGYAPYETSIDVTTGSVVNVDARLSPLANAGLLRVEDSANEGSTVFVDGVRVGQSPWEGTLAPGTHAVWTEKGDRGSAPSSVVVLQGQTILARMASTTLGSSVSLSVEPATAEVSIDSVPVGKTRWEGRLPVGAHVVGAAEDGYRPRSTSIMVPAAAAAPVPAHLELEVDPTHPRWPRAPGDPIMGAFIGYTAASSLGGEAADRGDEGGTVSGFMAGGRLGYRLRFGLALEIAGGYASFGSNVSRHVTTGVGTDDIASYEIEEHLRVRGPFVAASASYRVGAGPSIGFLGRLGAGVLFARSSDDIEGRVSAGAGASAITANVYDLNAATTSQPFFLMPEIGAELRSRHLQVGVSFAAAIVPAEGPELEQHDLETDLDCNQMQPLSCARNSNRLQGERAYGPLLLWVPQVSVTYEF